MGTTTRSPSTSQAGPTQHQRQPGTLELGTARLLCPPDWPTVARWLGHADGGALAMKVYGHLRDEHSQTQAARVTFGRNGTEDQL